VDPLVFHCRDPVLLQVRVVQHTGHPLPAFQANHKVLSDRSTRIGEELLALFFVCDKL
jgi:hypothetical protein